MLPAILKLFPDKPDPVEIGPHGEALIFLLHLLVTGVLLCERLMIERQCQHDVGSDFPGVKCAVEAPKLYGMMAMKEAVQIEEVVAAAVVVLSAPPPVLFVPDGLNLLEGLRLEQIHLFHQIGVHFLAVLHPLRRNLQCFVEKVVVAGDDVDEVADAPGCVV